MENNQDYLKVAQAAAKKAGKIFVAKFGHPAKVGTKNSNPRDFVTEVDREIEQLIRKEISKAFPTHNITGEEFAKTENNQNKMNWVIDPVDGTTNFIHGIPMCCISIALWNNNQPIVGVVYNPILKLLYSASKNGGAFLNGKKIQVSKNKNTVSIFGGYSWGHNLENAVKDFPALVNVLNKIRVFGTTALEICYVASGQYDYHLMADSSFWDFAAAVLVVTEAGGKVTEWNGKPISSTSSKILVRNGHIHNHFLSHLKKNLL